MISYDVKYSVEPCANEESEFPYGDLKNPGFTRRTWHALRRMRFNAYARWSKSRLSKGKEEEEEQEEEEEEEEAEERKFPKSILRAEEDLAEAKTKIDRRNKRVLGERWLGGVAEVRGINARRKRTQPEDLYIDDEKTKWADCSEKANTVFAGRGWMKRAENDGKQVSQCKLGLPRCEYAGYAEELMMEKEQCSLWMRSKVAATCKLKRNLELL